jgi:ribosomal protein S18 acetylase RimI-like enzyme
MLPVPPAESDRALPTPIEAWLGRSAGNLAAFWDYGVQAMGQRWTHWAAAWAADPGSPTVIANSATLLQPLSEAAAGEAIARLSGFYNEAPGAPWVLWCAWPMPDLAAWGCTLIGEPPLMVRLPGSTPLALPAELRIVEVGDAAGLADFETVFINGYPVPELQPVQTGSMYDARVLGGPLRFLVGYVGQQPVTAAIAYVGPDVTGIYCVATLPEARGRGYGAAVTDVAARIDPALPAVLQASDLGYRVYERIGFTTVARYSLWLKPRQEAGNNERAESFRSASPQTD